MSRDFSTVPSPYLVRSSITFSISCFAHVWLRINTAYSSSLKSSILKFLDTLSVCLHPRCNLYWSDFLEFLVRSFDFILFIPCWSYHWQNVPLSGVPEYVDLFQYL